MYVRDPAGNLIEIDWPDARSLDPRIREDLVPLSATAPQTGDALTATLYLGRRDGGVNEPAVCDHHGDGRDVT